MGYNARLAVDAKNKLIAAEDVTNEVNDCQQLVGMAQAAKTNLELKQTEVVADKGYYNAAEISLCVEQGDHSLHSQSRYQRQHEAGIIRQEPVHL